MEAVVHAVGHTTPTRTWVAKLKIPAKGQTDHDAKHPGLKVRVFSSGRRVWFIRGRVRGADTSAKFIMLGEHPAMNEAAAEHAAANARHLLRQGIDPNQERQEKAITNNIAGMSFGALSARDKEALGRAATAMGTSTTTGDGGMTPEERKASKTLVYQCLPSRYGFNPDDVRRAEREILPRLSEVPA